MRKLICHIAGHDWHWRFPIVDADQLVSLGRYCMRCDKDEPNATRPYDQPEAASSAIAATAGLFVLTTLLGEVVKEAGKKVWRKAKRRYDQWKLKAKTS